MNPTIQPALIGAGAALITILIKDISIPYFKRKYSKEEEYKTLTERYSHPLANSSLSLFYRLKEMVVDGRFDYLNPEKRKNRFNEYKFISSVYRLSSLIGWIRAIKLEQSNLLLNSPSQNSTLSQTVKEFEALLADGLHVEIDIIRKLSKLWGIQLPKTQSKIAKIARECDQFRNCVFNDSFEGTSSTNQFDTIKELANKICTATKSQNLKDEIISETIERAKNILSPNQSLIYRDWQSAIGDTVIKETENSIRNFNVIGYAEFEDLIIGKNKWINIVSDLFNGIDFDKRDNDYRVQQLTRILKSTAMIILEIDKLNINSRPFTSDNISEVKQFLTD